MAQQTIVVTGAAGFIGREVVACARARGHYVRAVVRREAAIHPEWDDGVTPVVADLMQKGALAGALDGADTVIHLAATISGDAAQQKRDTVEATKALCEAMIDSPSTPRLVLISSVSVYAHDAVAEGGKIDEASALEATPEKRDVYCQNKLLQEQIAASFNLPQTILRPGAVYGPNALWNAHLGAPAGPVLVQFTKAGELPTVYVKNCALAIVKACETAPDGPINVIDPNPPARGQYLQSIGWTKPSVVLPWRLLSFLGQLLPFSSKPGLLHPAILQARMMPVRYDTAGMQALMDGEALTGFDAAIQASREAET
ncbi:NAD-dependent epimerase/dehydratase family protein [Loktanella sp. Alg231-35]|uniref:NAD-dependent epimerase/dehydratase family protein n=1 Tax=Loktanella sp. Alg231-35 TaxID=1922220 RepID=UPI000D54DDE4|nr:NAD(P)-dependent oxidoreductase [Loktanella sp. Alg231-35]